MTIRDTLKQVGESVTNIKAIAVFLLGLIFGGLAVVETVDNMITDALDLSYERDTEPVYYMVKMDVLKQQEKMNKDPDDIKKSDIEKYSGFCNGYFGKVYIKKQVNSVKIKAVCDSITKKYLDDFTSN